MNLIKHRNKLIAARDEMSRTIAAIDIVLAYVGVTRPSVKNSKVGDEKTGVRKSTLTKPFKSKKLPKKPKLTKGFAKRRLSAEGEARRRAGYNAYVKRMRAELASKRGSIAA